MCGIAGIFDPREARPVDAGILRSMADAIAHRGPDGDGFHVEPGVGLAHRRLSIIDIEGGAQPMGNEDGSVVVVYNGEIYDFRALMDELEAAGHVFATRCDTEVIVHGYEEWGEACVERFNGMFAFALWDRPRGRLFLARDRLGIKPLYYGVLPAGQVVFGSELKALLRHPGLRRDLDPRAVEDYFAFGYVPEPRSVFGSVQKLPPGHVLTIERGRPIPPPRRYWDVPFRPLGPLSDGEAMAGFLERFRVAVERRLVAEVPLGAFLSGGVDSSAVVHAMSRASGTPVRTCSISFKDPAFDEARWAAVVAEHCRTDHRVRRVDTDDFDLIDRLARVYDEPFADSSAIPTYRVCELARKDVVVALSGDGGDEMLAGYRRYQRHLAEEGLRRRVPRPLRRILRLAGAAYPRLRWAPRFLRARGTLLSLGREGIEGWAGVTALVPGDLRKRLYAPAFRRALAGHRGLVVLLGHATDAPADDPLCLAQYLDIKTYLPGDILAKVDRASMAFGLEVRVPFLDYTLVEWMTGLPSEMKIREGEGKWLLKKALEPHLPEAVLHRRKQGFAVPLATWFRGPLRERVRSTLGGSRLADSGVLDRDFLLRIAREHDRERQDHSAAIWAVLMFDAFLRQTLDADGRSSPATPAAMSTS